MDRIDFTIPCEVAPKQSTRFGKGRAYQTKKVKANAAELALYARRHCPSEPWDCAVQACLLIEYPWRSHDSAKRRSLKVVPKTTAPDCEQLSKQVLDTLEDVGFFTDDARVARLTVEKAWTGRSQVRVWLRKID